MLCIHAGFAILSVVRLASHRLQGAFFSDTEGSFFENYFLTVVVATWVALIISFLFYCFSKYSAVMAISFLSILYYFWGL